MNPERPKTFKEYKTLFHLAKEFDKVDTDRDLHIGYQELLEMLKSMGIRGTGKTLPDAFAERDEESKDSLSFYQIFDLLTELNLMPAVALAAHATEDINPSVETEDEDEDMMDLASMGVTPDTDEFVFLRRLAFYVADAKRNKSLGYDAFVHAIETLVEFLQLPEVEAPTSKDIKEAFDVGTTVVDKNGRKMKKLEHAKTSRLDFDEYEIVVPRLVIP